MPPRWPMEAPEGLPLAASTTATAAGRDSAQRRARPSRAAAPGRTTPLIARAARRHAATLRLRRLATRLTRALDEIFWRAISLPR